MRDPLSGFECNKKHYHGKTYWFATQEELFQHELLFREREICVKPGCHSHLYGRPCEHKKMKPQPCGMYNHKWYKLPGNYTRKCKNCELEENIR